MLEKYDLLMTKINLIFYKKKKKNVQRQKKEEEKCLKFYNQIFHIQLYMILSRINDIQELGKHYFAVLQFMPYNICSALTIKRTNSGNSCILSAL